VRNLAAEGQIEVGCAGLLTGSSESREYPYQILLMEELARHGVETLFVKAPPGRQRGKSRVTNTFRKPLCISAIHLWLGPVVQLPHLTVVLEIRK
jgi:hypothetical protein